MDDNEYGKITVSENEDGKAVWEFEGLVTSDVPLDTDAQDFGGAINELSKKLQQGGGGDEPTEDWQPPVTWIPVPDPAAYEIYLLIEVADLTNTNKFSLYTSFQNPKTGSSGDGPLSIDWGDGEENTYTGYEYDENGDIIEGSTTEWGGNSHEDVLKHGYSETGQYLIKITTSELSCHFRTINQNTSYPNLLICKSGSNIVYCADFETENVSNSYLYLGKKIKYFKHLGENKFLSSMFYECSSLSKVEFAEPLKTISPGMFFGCCNLRNLDTSEVTDIQTGAFASNSYSFLQNSMNFPKCIKVGNFAFQYCAGLEKIDLPVCEEIGDYAFQYAYSLSRINAPNCKTVGIGAFWDSHVLQEADFPNCTSIGGRGFYGCYGLSTVVAAENCTFGSQCFNGCYSLYPRPDGSIN